MRASSPWISPSPSTCAPSATGSYDFVQERIIPREQEMYSWWVDGDPGAALMAELRAQAKAEGMWAIGHPKEVGGGGMPFMDYVYINEVIGLSEPAVWVFGTGTLQDSLMLNEYASPEWRDRYLGPLVDGDIIQSFGMTEPAVASSDATQLQTTAVLDGDEWVINGRKWFTSLAHYAKYTTVIARTEDDADRPHLAFSAIIVPDRHARLQHRARGARCSASSRATTARSSTTTCGFPRTTSSARAGRASCSARSASAPDASSTQCDSSAAPQRAYDFMCDRAVRRVAFGGPLADKQLIQQMVFETAAEIRACRHIALDAAEQMDRGDPARVEIGMIKVLTARMFHNAVDRAIQVHGGMGVTGDLPLERFYKEARLGRIWDGPDETHIATVARLLLKPYRDAAAARLGRSAHHRLEHLPHRAAHQLQQPDAGNLVVREDAPSRRRRRHRGRRSASPAIRGAPRRTRGPPTSSRCGAPRCRRSRSSTYRAGA